MCGGRRTWCGRSAGRKFISGPQGEHYDLEEIFERLNAGSSSMACWAARSWAGAGASSRSMLGHFDPSHNAIIISRIFDRPRCRRWRWNT